MMEDPLVGLQLANYRIERLIGHGGMASVYYAQDIKLERPVAIKVIDARFRGNPSYTQRFLQEARAVAAWRHEHIIQVFYAGDEDGLYYFAMEFVDGPNLSQILAQYTFAGDLMPHKDVLRYGRAIAEALDFAHSKNVIHRDVKPSNVLVSSDGRIVLGDFGLALHTQQGSMGEIFGTAHYTAPEQAKRSNAAVPQSDLYSLGVMLFEMLTGVLPFDDPSPTSVALQHMTLPPPSPCQLNPALNSDTESVLLKILAKKPPDRYPNGADLMDALEKALHQPARISAGLPLPPPPAPIVQQTTLASEPADWSTHITSGVIGKVEPPPVKEPILIEQAGQTNTPNAEETQPEPAQVTTRRHQSRARSFWVWMGLGGCSVLLILALIVAALVLFEVVPLSSAANASPSVTSLAVVSLATASSTRSSIPATGASSSFATTTASPQPSPTNRATVTPTLLPPTPTPTSKYLDGRHFKLFYNDTSFYMLQVAGKNGPIAPIAFEKLADTGQVLNRFDGTAWAEYFENTLQAWCMRLEIMNASEYLRPAECGVNYSATRWPVASSDVIFWTARPGSTEFRILWKSEEVGRCQIAAGTCEVYLP